MYRNTKHKHYKSESYCPNGTFAFSNSNIILLTTKFILCIILFNIYVSCASGFALRSTAFKNLVDFLASYKQLMFADVRSNCQYVCIQCDFFTNNYLFLFLCTTRDYTLILVTKLYLRSVQFLSTLIVIIKIFIKGCSTD